MTVQRQWRAETEVIQSAESGLCEWWRKNAGGGGERRADERSRKGGEGGGKPAEQFSELVVKGQPVLRKHRNRIDFNKQFLTGVRV